VDRLSTNTEGYIAGKIHHNHNNCMLWGNSRKESVDNITDLDEYRCFVNLKIAVEKMERMEVDNRCRLKSKMIRHWTARHSNMLIEDFD
jgi:hypothetical protein